MGWNLLNPDISVAASCSVMDTVTTTATTHLTRHLALLHITSSGYLSTSAINWQRAWTEVLIPRSTLLSQRPGQLFQLTMPLKGQGWAILSPGRKNQSFFNQAAVDIRINVHITLGYFCLLNWSWEKFKITRLGRAFVCITWGSSLGLLRSWFTPMCPGSRLQVPLRKPEEKMEFPKCILHFLCYILFILYVWIWR